MKAPSVLGSIVSGLSKNPDFKEYSILSDGTMQCLLSLDAVIVSAGRVSGQLAKSFNPSAAKVLRLVTAVLQTAGMCRAEIFSQLLGINRNSKYLDIVIENTKQHESFLKVEGDIKVGEKVS